LKVTAQLFEAYLKCPTKCFFQYKGEAGERTAFAEWLRAKEETYLIKYIKCLTQGTATQEQVFLSPSAAGSLKRAKWLFGVGVKACTQNLETVIQVMERLPAIKRSRTVQVIPIRFTFFNKLTGNNRMQLAFDSLVLSEVLGRKICLGKIVHGDEYTVAKVKTDTLESEVRRFISEINLLLSKGSPPDPALNQHCNECEFQTICRQKAIEHDDLSLLSSVSEKERKKFNNKGIFTITHLSYTFRPRRKSKQFRGKGEKYHHSLKALAIRQHKIHVVGRDEPKIEGTPVYLDVEGIPDRNFYYLIGVRIRTNDEIIQHSLWADTQADENNIWNKFIEILSGVNNPIIIHYGSFEMSFLKQMHKRYGGPEQGSTVFKAINNSLNLLSFIYARIYFPTYSNGLKDVAKYLGFNWTDANASGIQAIIWRMDWERLQEAALKHKLIVYNAEDCEALDYVTELVSRISEPKGEGTGNQATDVVDTDSLVREGFFRFRKIQFSLAAMEEINRTAYWDYQHEKIILRSSKRLKRIAKAANKRAEAKPKVNKVIHWPPPQTCPRCGQRKVYKNKKCSKDILDIQFGRSSIKKWVTKYMFHGYRCPACGAVFYSPDRTWSGARYGPNLMTLSAYLNIELRMPQASIATFLNQVLHLNLSRNVINRLKAKAATVYKSTYDNVLQKIFTGKLVHADETKVNVGSTAGYVWAFTSMENVAYVYAASREGDLVKTLLKEFKGVLITDFYGAYESIDCPQQKCLIHLIRDLNDDLMKEPFNEELKALTGDFADLLKSIVATVDRFGLKTRFLRKHKTAVKRFFKNLSQRECQTEIVIKWIKRFEKNRSRLFTFLDYDNVPWNNNNAEHAIKAIAFLRRDLHGVSTEKGIGDYLTLLSVLETCKFKGVSFLDFLRSGEKDIDTFIDNRIKFSKT
jgi:predicted RecB family nuclease